MRLSLVARTHRLPAGRLCRAALALACWGGLQVVGRAQPSPAPGPNDRFRAQLVASARFQLTTDAISKTTTQPPVGLNCGERPPRLLSAAGGAAGGALTGLLLYGLLVALSGGPSPEGPTPEARRLKNRLVIRGAVIGGLALAIVNPPNPPCRPARPID